MDSCLKVDWEKKIKVNLLEAKLKAKWEERKQLDALLLADSQWPSLSALTGNVVMFYSCLNSFNKISF